MAFRGLQQIQQPSPAERFQRAVHDGPMTPEERAAFHSAVARVAAQDDARRAVPSPQADLLEAA